MIALVGGGGIAAGIAEVVPGCVVPGRIDVRDMGSVRSAIGRRYDTIVYCAGVSVPHEVKDGTVEGNTYQAEIEANLIGAFNVAAEALFLGTPTLIFIASVAGMYGKPNHAGYCASKAGVISLVQSLAMEGHNAYAISPGRVDTPMRERDYPGEDPRTRLTPQQIGGVVADILAGEYEPGDNIIIRKIGFDTHLRVDKGEPWKEWLKVGQPVTV